MKSLLRTLPYIWRYRFRLVLSVGMAFLTAFLWGANLSAAFPVIKILMQGQSLQEYVSAEVTKAEAEIADQQRILEVIDDKIAEREANKDAPTEDEASVDLLAERSKHQNKLSVATTTLYTMRWMDHHVTPWFPTELFATFAMLLMILFVATLLKSITIFLQDYLVGSIVELAILNIRRDLFHKALRRDYQSLTQNGTAELMSRFTFDLLVLSQGLSLMGGRLVREPLKAISCIVLAFWVSWQLTLMALIVVPIMGLVFYRFGKSMKKASQQTMESMSKIYETLEETFESLKVVLTFGRGRHHRLKLHKAQKRYFKKALKVVSVDAMARPTTELLGMLAVIAAVMPGAYLVLSGETKIWGVRLADSPMDIAQLAVHYTLLAGVLDPIRKLSSVYSKLKRSSVAGERVFAFLDQSTEVKEVDNPVAMPACRESIVFDNVSFGYEATGDNSKRQLALSEVSFQVNAGEAIAVVGSNGSGKSTLLSMLPRLYDPTAGSVLIDGVDISSVSLRELRSSIGIVAQETYLFNETISDNIRYGLPGARREQIEEAARKAYLTEVIETLPDGFDTMIGHKGNSLSGGQRQRVSLARAILRNPSILILDEATSAIDAQSELLIHQALKEFTKERTTFVITHAMTESVLAFVDRIVVMHQGHLVGFGTHDELIENCVMYRDLYQVQKSQMAA